MPLFVIVKVKAATYLFISLRLSSAYGQGGRLIYHIASGRGGLDLGLGIVISLALVLGSALIFLLTSAVGQTIES